MWYHWCNLVLLKTKRKDLLFFRFTSPKPTKSIRLVYHFLFCFAICFVINDLCSSISRNLERCCLFPVCLSTFLIIIIVGAIDSAVWWRVSRCLWWSPVAFLLDVDTPYMWQVNFFPSVSKYQGETKESVNKAIVRPVVCGLIYLAISISPHPCLYL